MKKILLLLTVAGLTLFGSGCQTKRLPAGDVDIYKKYADEIKIMHSKISPDSELKFKAAVTLFNNIDFSFLREPQVLVKILGTYDARIINVDNKQYVQYRYRYDDKYILARFLLIKDMIVTSFVKSNVVKVDESTKP